MPRTASAAWVILLALLGAVLPMAAQPDDPMGEAIPAVSVAMIPQRGQVERGDVVAFAITLDHAPGFHTWPNEPVLPPEFRGLSPIATTVEIPTPLPAAVASIEEVIWPKPSPVPVSSPTGGTVDILSFHERAVVIVVARIRADAPLGRFEFSAVVGYQACDERGCEAPEAVTVTAKVDVVAGTGTLFDGLDLGAYAIAPPVVKGEGGKQQVKARASVEFSRVAPGSTQRIAVELTHLNGFHTWPADPEVPPEFRGLVPVPTTLTLPERDAAPWLASSEVRFPEGSMVKVRTPNGRPGQLRAYHGREVIMVTLAVGADAPAGRVKVPVTVRFQACDESVCLPPERVTIELEFDIGPGDAVGATGVDSTMFATGAPPAPESTGDDPSPPPAQVGGEADDGVSTGGRMFLGFIPVPEGGGFVALAAVALLGGVGGLVLNLTPCVLPVIPIKVMTISKHAGSRERTLFLGSVMALGVVAFWVGISIPVIAWQSFGDPSALFGIWWFTLGMGLLIGVMALGLLGLFVINLPQSVYMVNPKADTATGSFLFGVMTGVLGLPCFGFVAGALLGAIAGQPRIMTVVVFTSIGVGMALPYLVLSMWPALVKKIPRTGPASELVKQFLGFLMLAAAAYFIGAGLTALGKESPHVNKALIWWAVAFFVVIGGAWLSIRTLTITKKPVRRIAFVGLGALLAWGSVAWAQGRTRQARLDAALWHEFTPAAFEEAREAGKVVVLDFTAVWCLNCQTLKAQVLDRPEVREAMLAGDVVALEADLTSESAPGWQALKDLGETGIPMLAVFGPGTSEPWKSNAYTPAQVMKAIRSARGG